MKFEVQKLNKITTRLNLLGGCFLVFFIILWASDWIHYRYIYPPSDDTAVHLLAIEEIKKGIWGLYPPFLRIILLIGSSIWSKFGRIFLIFMPIFTVGGALPFLTYSIMKTIFVEKKNALLGTALAWINVPLLLQQAFVQSPAEIFSILFVFTSLFFISRKKYTAAIVFTVLSLATHHLSSLPFIGAVFLFLGLILSKRIAPFIIGRKQKKYLDNIVKHLPENFLSKIFMENSQAKPQKKRYVWIIVTSILLLITTLSIALQPSYRVNVKLIFEQVLLNLDQKIGSQDNSLYEKPSLPPHVKIFNIPKALHASSIFTAMTTLGMISSLLLIRRRHHGKKLLLLTTLWIITLYILAQIRSEIPHLNIRLIRLMIFPSVILASVGFVMLYRTLPKKINTAFFILFFIAGAFQLGVRINGASAGSQFVRLTPADVEAIDFINSHSSGSESVLTNAHYTTWLDVAVAPTVYRGYLNTQDENPPFGKILTSRHGGDEIRDQYGRPLRSIYNIKYIYIGHSTPDRNNELEIKHLLKSKQWEIVVQNESVTLLRYVPERK